MKNLVVLILATMFFATGSICHSGTVAVVPDGTEIVNFATYDLNATYHAQVVITAYGNDYITLMDCYGNAYAWGYVNYDYYGNNYLYVSDDGYNYYYYGEWD